MCAPTQQRLPFAAVCLTAIIAFQSVGWLLAWQGLQFGARIEAQRVLFQGKNSIPERSFQQAFFQKIKIGRKEIRLDGQLFDFRILSETSDSVRVALFHDRHEQALLSTLGLVFQTEDNPNNPAIPPMVLWLAKWLGSAFLLPEKPSFSPGFEPRFQQQSFTALFFMAQFAPGVFAPPPEV